MMGRFAVTAILSFLLAGHSAVGVAAQDPAAGGMPMPDPKQMSGIPLPASDLAPGTVTVRVIKGSLANAVPQHAVELQGAGISLKAQTNDSGRAEFTGIRPGSRLRALAVVAGERLESQEFEAPAAGGVRLMLVATDPEAGQQAHEDRALASAPPQPGTVVLGEQSRFVIEHGDDGMSVFGILQILNTARTPVQPAQPLAFDLPDRADGVSLLEGSSPQASVAGRRVTVAGPFAPGTTLVQFAYSVRYSGDTLTLEQRLPVSLTQLSVIAQKVGDMHMSSSQIAGHREMTAEGQTYIVAKGPAVGAGDVLTLRFTGLPHQPTWPRTLAVALAVLILAAGAWASLHGSRGAAAGDSRRGGLEATRERLFADLTALEQEHMAGTLEPRGYASRRRDLVNALERVYAELDEQAA